MKKISFIFTAAILLSTHTSFSAPVKEKKQLKVVIIKDNNRQVFTNFDYSILNMDSVQTVNVYGDSLIEIRMKPAKAPAPAKKKTK